MLSMCVCKYVCVCVYISTCGCFFKSAQHANIYFCWSYVQTVKVETDVLKISIQGLINILSSNISKMSSLKTWKFSLRRTKIFNHSQEILKREAFSIRFLLNSRVNFQVLWAIFILIKISHSVKGDRIISEVIIKWDNNFWMNAFINLIIKWNSILLIRLLTESLQM